MVLIESKQMNDDVAQQSASASASTRVLLLLDDEENILTSLTRLLRGDGYRILKTTSAQRGFELLASEPVGVILSDQRMPEMSGTEFLRRAKQLYPDTIRMVLSGYTDLKSITDAINEGAVYKFLTKPWEDDLLRGSVAEAFERFEMGQENQRLTQKLQSTNAALSNTKRELENHVEQKTNEALGNLAVLQVSQQLLEELPVGVVGLDEDGMIVIANRAATLLLKCETTPMIGSYLAERFPAALADRVGVALRRKICDGWSCELGGINTRILCNPIGSPAHPQGVVITMMLE